MSKWTEHVLRWRDCELCSLCETRNKVVLLRGQIPCDVLFVGEAPGESEDVFGKPFYGPAGNLLERMLSDAGWNVADHDIEPVRRAFTNLIGCLPQEEDTEREGLGSKWKLREPTKEEIKACAPRLREIVEITRPRVILLVGRLAENWVPKILAGEDTNVKGRSGNRLSGAKTGKGKTGPSTPLSRRDTGGKKAATKKRGEVPGPNDHYRFESIIHPAAILRADISRKALAAQQTVIKLRDIAEDLITL